MKGLTNPYLRALLGSVILYSARAQIVAVASNSKGFGVFIFGLNKTNPNKFGLVLFGADEGT